MIKLSRYAIAFSLLALTACSGKYVKPEMATHHKTPLDGVVGIKGKPLALDVHDKVTVIEFFASWCRTCQKEMPELEYVYRQFKDKDIKFVGISTDYDFKAYTDFVKENKLTFDTGWDQSQDAQIRFDIEQIPATIILDKTGKVIYRTQGDTQKGPEAIGSFIKTLSSQPTEPLASLQ